MSQTRTIASSRPETRAWIAVALALAAGALLRFQMLRAFFEVRDDSQMYGGIAKNLLRHGAYALGDGPLHLTLIRLPGYPLFLAACFRLFGMENYWAACIVQISLDLVACLLLGDIAARITRPNRGSTARVWTVWLAACCPFTAIYAAEPLTEAPTVFCIALALWAMARFWQRPAWASALAFTFAVSYAALLRPDGALVGMAFAPVMAVSLLRARVSSGRKVAMGLACLLLALAPFAVWAARNWRVYHVVQPLAPRYATDPGEETWPGWQAWVKSWSLDFVSTYDIYWNAPGGPLDLGKLPARAFDSAAERAATAQLAADYEKNGQEFSPEIDARFMELARRRAAAHPVRAYLLLPLGRMADMWLRPRIENLPIDLDWWQYGNHRAETRFSWFYVGLNLAYLLGAAAGLLRRPSLWLPMLAYLVLRSAMLCNIEAPEARYTIECFPMLFVLCAVAFTPRFRRAAEV